ncbi:EF hand domain protein [Metarhizium album ARSEF 1941]|uniref:EF hand domain protein n=1 Tax=Metarhizium album (strain ARSEF 1941) TaxID=1081103 RepID=A0A0B2WNE9_METAS|nr:EF hand domain protein [Metarhizium album ARSEF 1941]KHN94530.1 EF hand domain protein [Metarhizium album ARSEF 1941]
MWPCTPSADSLTRPRIVVAVVSVVAAASIGYYAYQSRQSHPSRLTPTGGGLHRSNAIRRPRHGTNEWNAHSSPSDVVIDENTRVIDLRGQRPTDHHRDADHQDADRRDAEDRDAETVVDVDAGGDDWWNQPGANSLQTPSIRTGHSIVTLLFRVSEDNARRNGCVHRGCQCNSCGMVPIRGVRYRCANCADFDLCETCEAQGVHNKTHIFYKIKIPAPPFGPRQMQPVWYTGDPDTCRRNLSKALIARLSRDTGFERPELEAFWEQWTYMANTEWRNDPDGLCIAMDRKTFERCLVPTGGSRHAAPNLIHDRMFSFYDSNDDGLIGFSEFLRGLSYRKRRDKLRKVFEGYDIDGDGYVNRRDFLRMFRAYYVLYKQMHKDILDGLDDQLLATNEAQQLISSRQPLSSLFGRDIRIPPGDLALRVEGKIHRRDGSIEVAEGFNGVFVENRGDTASREDILASLFAYDADTRPHRRFVRHNDAETNWRMMRRVSGGDQDRAYWSSLLDPPTTLDDISHVFTNTEDEDLDSDGDDDEDEEEDDGDMQDDDSGRTYSELRARAVARSRKLAPKLERQRRDMARRHLHDRWKRRQFYLDEEEGGMAPDDWDADEDILARMNQTMEDSKASDTQPMTTRSRSSSKVRFAEDTDDYDIRSNPSTSSRSVPERWGGMDIPDAEKDAGKEILYQVTQQAFNELLDTIFKKAEDVAIAAAESAIDRETYKAEIDATDLLEPECNAPPKERESDSHPADKAISEKSLDELLADTGYAVVPDESRNAVEFENSVEVIHEEQAEGTESSTEDENAEFHDPTLPQFRPNTVAEADELAAKQRASERPAHPRRSSSRQSPLEEPDAATLRSWKRLNIAEAEAMKRGGWGRLSFEEFEEIYKSQEDLGNRLDYLGSWIDFCIP